MIYDEINSLKRKNRELNDQLVKQGAAILRLLTRVSELDRRLSSCSGKCIRSKQVSFAMAALRESGIAPKKKVSKAQQRLEI